MRLGNDRQAWGPVSIALHWLTFLLVLGLGTVGLLMTELATSPLKIQIYSVHKSLGLTVLALTVLRVFWLLASGRPEPVPGGSRWQHRLALGAHGGLYLLLLAMPLSGWLYNSAAGYPLRWFGLLALPSLTGFDPALKHFARDTHQILFYALAGLVAIHAAASLWHHYRLRDHTLSRMLPLPRHKDC